MAIYYFCKKGIEYNNTIIIIEIKMKTKLIESLDFTEEEYNDFYTDKFYDYEKPLRVVRSEVEGRCSYTSLLFIPSHAPFDYYSKDYENS